MSKLTQIITTEADQMQEKIENYLNDLKELREYLNQPMPDWYTPATDKKTPRRVLAMATKQNEAEVPVPDKFHKAYKVYKKHVSPTGGHASPILADHARESLVKVAEEVNDEYGITFVRMSKSAGKSEQWLSQLRRLVRDKNELTSARR